MNLCPYPQYKPSGVEWLGDVPEHWATARLREYLVMEFTLDDECLKGRDGHISVKLPCTRMALSVAPAFQPGIRRSPQFPAGKPGLRELRRDAPARDRLAFASSLRFSHEIVILCLTTPSTPLHDAHQEGFSLPFQGPLQESSSVQHDGPNGRSLRLLNVIEPNSHLPGELGKQMEGLDARYHKEMGFPSDWRTRPLWARFYRPSAPAATATPAPKPAAIEEGPK